MKIPGVGSSKTAASAKRKKTASGKGADFAKTLRNAAVSAPPADAVEPAPVGPVESVLSVQEVPDATQERSRGLIRQYGEDILGRLEDIRHGLLIGSMPKEKLADLAQTMRAQRRQSDDPKLNEIIDEIELRAEVEIAKLTRDTGRPK
ncbi:MAG: flagellar assembly protein FliX [Rhodospirillales bacterium]|nr:flagellar assembly protein FliX [Rhodospirillales bacterium]